MTKRPRRQRKADRLTSPDASALEIQCDYALAPFDEDARAIERKWGIDRLPALVSTDLASKYGFTIGKLNEAIQANDPAEVTRWAESARRGLVALDAAAEAAGAKQMPVKSASCEFEGRIFTVMQEIADMENYEKQPNEAVFTIREFAVVMKAMKLDCGLVEAVKENLKGAEVIEFRSKLSDDFWKNGGDEIPF